MTKHRRRWLDDGEDRTARLYIRLTPSEREAIKRAAKRASLPDSEWVRRQLSVAARQMELPR